LAKISKKPTQHRKKAVLFFVAELNVDINSFFAKNLDYFRLLIYIASDILTSKDKC
jgi:hypothetical protein